MYQKKTKQEKTTTIKPTILSRRLIFQSNYPYMTEFLRIYNVPLENKSESHLFD